MVESRSKFSTSAKRTPRQESRFQEAGMKGLMKVNTCKTIMGLNGRLDGGPVEVTRRV